MLMIVIIVGVCFLGVILAIAVMENNKKEVVQVPIEKIVYKDKIVYKEKIVYKDKIVYVDKPIEKIIYKDKIVYVDKPIEKIVYIDAPTKTETKASNQKTNLLKELQDLKNKKKKTKKDIENIYTLEMVIPNIK